MIHGLSGDISGQYDRVTGRNDTGRNAHSTCGRRESLEDLTRSQASMSCRWPPLTHVEGTLFLPAWHSNSFPKSWINHEPTGVVPNSLLPDERKTEHNLREIFQL